MGAAAAAFLAAGGGLATREFGLVLLLAGPALCGFAETFNDWADRKTDIPGAQQKLWGMSLAGGSGAIVDGLASAKHAAFVSVACALAAVVLALPLGLPALVTTGMCLATAFCYSAPRIRGKDRRLIGQLLLVLGYGPLAVLLGTVSCPAGSIGTVVLLCGMFCGLYVMAIGITADVLDIRPSKSCPRSLAEHLGRERTLRYSGLLGVLFPLVLSYKWYGLPITSWHGFYFAFLGVSVVRCVAFLIHARTCDVRLWHGLAVVLEAAFPFLVLKTWLLS
jgi:4-hydroxybenzoate polyprenyltransferase